MTIENDYEFTPEELAELKDYESERNSRLRKAVLVTLVAAAVLITLVGVLT